MSQGLDEVTAPSLVTPQAPSANTAAADSVTTPTPEPEPAKETEEKKPTSYVVLAGAAEDGPWERIGTFEGHGQTAAKKAAVTALTAQGTDANAYWFLAIPISSYVPEKPSVKVTTVVSF